MLLLFFCSLPGTAQEFSGSFQLVTQHTYAKGNQRNDTLSYFFGRDTTAVIIKGRGNQGDLRLVFVPADSTITGLFEMNGKKGGYILPMNEKYWPGMPYAQRPYGTGPRKAQQYTGVVSEVEGERCREVVAESERYTATMCVAEDIPLPFSIVLAYQTVGAGESTRELEEFDQFGLEGLPLSMSLQPKSGSRTVQLAIHNLSHRVDPSVFSSEGHTLSRIEE